MFSHVRRPFFSIIFLFSSISALFGQIANLSPEDWLGVSAVIVRSRGARTIITESSDNKVYADFEASSSLWNLTYAVEQNQLTFEILPGSSEGRSDLQATLSLKIPPEIQVQAMTTTGELSIVGMKNLREAKSHTAAVTIRNCSGEIRCETLSGNILIQGFRGDFWVLSLSGDIQMNSSEPKTRGEAQSISGNVFLSMTQNRNQYRVTSATLNDSLSVFGQNAKYLIRSGTGIIRIRAVSSSGSVEVWAP